MPTHGMPQNGWWTDEEWADCLQESIKTFRKKVRQHGIPVHRWGNLWLINAQEFYAALPPEGPDSDDDPPSAS